MVETLLAILAAIIVIIVAGILVRHQEAYSSQLQELNDKIISELNEAAIEFRALTGENPIEISLEGLEQDMEALTYRLRSAESKNHPYINRRKKHVKRQKNFTND